MIDKTKLDNGDKITDMDVDASGRFVAVGYSSGGITIYDITTESNFPIVCQLEAHKSEVVRVDFSHSLSDVYLASCSTDCTFVIFQESKPSKWSKIHEFTHHSAPLRDIEWALDPSDLCLAVAASDGTCSIAYPSHQTWKFRTWQAHPHTATAIAWGPQPTPTDILAGPWDPKGHTQAQAQQHDTRRGPPRICTGGPDGLRLWVYRPGPNAQWTQLLHVPLGGAWVWDLAWRPPLGAGTDHIAAATSRGTYIFSVIRPELVRRRAARAAALAGLTQPQTPQATQQPEGGGARGTHTTPTPPTSHGPTGSQGPMPQTSPSPGTGAAGATEPGDVSDWTDGAEFFLLPRLVSHGESGRCRWSHWGTVLAVSTPSGVQALMERYDGTWGPV